MITNFKTLDIWKRSRILVKEIYLVSKEFPQSERFGLTDQIRRAIISVPSNIAEGCGRSTPKDLSRFLDISVGSICEVETQIYLAFDLEYITEPKARVIANEISEIRRMIIGYQKTL
jgi:four helix bundle protein